MSDDLKPRELGDGLVLRWATEDDVERIATLTSHVFRETAEEPPNPENVAWLRDLGSGRHPLTHVDRCVFVEDTHTGQVIACTWLISTVWTYGGMRFGVARPEHVASHPDYRRRGLMRALFEAFHARSAAEGDRVQAITGIPYYYRQFGYEYALDLNGSRTVALDDIPALHDGEADAYRLREAGADNLPFVMALHERDRQRSLVSTEISEVYWHWMLYGVNHASGIGGQVLLITDAAGTPCGYVLLRSRRWTTAVDVLGIGVSHGVSLHAVIRPVLRALRGRAPIVPAVRAQKPARDVAFVLGASHPVYDVLGEGLAPRRNRPYAWYVRVADLPGFLRYVAPVLERQLVSSPLAGYSGELQLDFYRGGLRLVFENGRLTTAEDWQRPVWGKGPDGGFPPLVFLQLVFGRRSLEELRHVIPDVWATDDVEPLLKVLFPTHHSHVMALG